MVYHLTNKTPSIWSFQPVEMLQYWVFARLKNNRSQHCDLLLQSDRHDQSCCGDSDGGRNKFFLPHQPHNSKMRFHNEISNRRGERDLISILYRASLQHSRA